MMKSKVSLYQRRDTLLQERQSIQESLNAPLTFDPEDWQEAIARARIDDMRDAGTRAIQFETARDAVQAEAQDTAARKATAETRLLEIVDELKPLQEAIATEASLYSAATRASIKDK